MDSADCSAFELLFDNEEFLIDEDEQDEQEADVDELDEFLFSEAQLEECGEYEETSEKSDYSAIVSVVLFAFIHCYKMRIEAEIPHKRLFFVLFAPLVLGCSSGGSLEDAQILTDPTLSFTASPPVSWTYFPVVTGAAGTAPAASWFPGQSETQLQAMQQATNDVQAAILQAFNSLNLNAMGITSTVTYTPDMIMNCFTAIAPPANSLLGRLAAGAITETALVTGTAGTTTPFTMCPPPSNAMGVAPFEAYIKPVQIITRGYTTTRFKWRQIAAEIQSTLSTRNSVLFRSEITLS